MHILPRRPPYNINNNTKSDEKRLCAIIEADLTKIPLNNPERNSIGKEIIKSAKKISIFNVDLHYAFISDNKRKVIIFVSYENEDDFNNFYRDLQSKVNINNKEVFLFNEGINVLQR